MIFNGTTTRIPEELLLAHQEGKVVFFCGAGISRDAGIPIFSELVSESASRHKLSLPIESDRLECGECDSVYQWMETQTGPDNRSHLRKATAKLLAPRKPIRKENLAYHFALLKLATTSDRKLHLVTTNYDELFDVAARRLKKRIASYAAPLLPIPKESKWDGLVYLHGKLQNPESEDNLKSLVLSSGDFGVAYLTERWASRFITELFRTYVICFIGYSANDTIMRYILDAFAADWLNGEKPRKVYAFDGYISGEKDKLLEQWERKGVEVISFKKENKNDFSELRRTLAAWSDYYSLGVNGPARIILDDAVRKPTLLNQDDKDCATRVVWALKTTDGLAARQFSELTPVASIEWFDIFRDTTINELKVYRADSYDGKKVVPPRELIPISQNPVLNDSARHILDWLAKHLGNPIMLRKICGLPRPLSPLLIDFIEQNVFALDLNSISEPLRKVWLLWLESERVSSNAFYAQNGNVALSILRGHQTCSGLEKILHDLLTPRLNLMPTTGWPDDKEVQSNRLQFLVSWEYKVGASVIVDWEGYDAEGVFDTLPATLVTPLVDALNRLCEMRRELGDEQDESDFYSLSLQDVSGPIDADNSHYPEWATLVVFLRHAWMNLLKENRDEATCVAQKWFLSSHPLFKRMALFAATKDTALNANEVVSWLIERKDRLFSQTYRREILDFILARGSDIEDRVLVRLDGALSVPTEGFSVKSCTYCRALVLDRLIDAKVRLPDTARRFYDVWVGDKPKWKKRQKKFDGLAQWISDGSDELWMDETHRIPEKMPDLDGEIATWLWDEYEKCTDNGIVLENDEWRNLCRGNICRAIRVLMKSFMQGHGLSNSIEVFWKEAAQEDHALELWNCLQDDNAGKMISLNGLLTSNLKLVAKWFLALSEQGVDVDSYLKFGNSLLDLPADKNGNDGETYKILMEGILRRWYDTGPKDDGGIMPPFREVFAVVAQGNTFAAQNARKELLTQLSNLTLIDKEWTFKTLTPVLSWRSKDALESWKAAIKMTWRNADLMEHIKEDFIETAKHFKELDEGSKWYAHIVVLMGVATNKGYEPATFMRILRDLPDEGRLQVAYDIQNRLHNSIDKIDACWKDEIGPFVKTMWPSDKVCMNPEIAGVLFVGIAYCNTSFHDATRTLLNLYGGHIVVRDVAARLSHPPYGTTSRCKLYPDDVLDVLIRVDMSKRDVATASNIKKCLDQIRDMPLKSGEGTYESDERYQRLLVFVNAR